MLHLHQILNGIFMMEANFASNYLPLIASYIKGESNLLISTNGSAENTDDNIFFQFAAINNGSYEISEYGTRVRPEDAPENSVAIINVSGAITKYDQTCGPSGMLTKSDIMKRCYANKNIKAIVLRTDSGGGEGNAMFLMIETINQKNKPVIGFIDDFACSAAYGILSSCDMIIANSTHARIGSIGTYITITDYAERLKNLGINLIEVYASVSSDKNREFHEAIKGNLEPVREIANIYNEKLLMSVETGRTDKLKSGRKEWGTGKVFFSEKAKEHGLIDDIDTFENVLNYFNT